MDKSSPIIAIVGRPNTGKSTIFNRLLGTRYAIISKEAGTTRDRISRKFELDKYEITLVDTGGIENDKKGNIEENIQIQVKIAINEADIILFVVDITQQLTADDFTAANILRKSDKPIILIANKTDNAELEKNIFNIFELGFGEPMKFSAIHNIGVEELKNTIIKKLKALKFHKKKTNKKEEEITNICILGKPNSGKSSLVNAFFGSEKIIVSEIPGTTRDTIDTEIIYNNKKYNLIDTAGIRSRGKIEKGIEQFSILRTLSSIEKTDIVVLIIDGITGVTSQDCHIAQYALEAEKGLILVVNKTDLFDKNQEEKTILGLRRKFIFVPWSPVIFISAKEKKNIYEILKISDSIKEERAKRIKTTELNTFLQKITFKHMPASAKIQKPKFMYGSQVDINPPKFVLFFKYAENLHFSYPRYLENEIRKEFGFNGTSISLKFKNSISKKS